MLLKVILSALILTFLYNVLVMGVTPGLGLSLFLIATNFYLFFLRNTKSTDETTSNTRLGIIFSLVSSIFALLFVFRANSVVQFINIAGSVFSLGVAGYFYKSDESFSYSERILFYPLVLLGKSIAAFGDLLKIGQSTFERNGQKNTLGRSVIRGLIGAVPLIAILLFILSSADPIFAKVLSTIFSNVGERAVVSSIVLIGALLVAFAKIANKEALDKMQSQVKNNTIELSIIAGSVGVIFAGFILIQIQYLFLNVGERELAALGIAVETYSEYVRKGFFELLVAAAVASTVLIGVLRYLRGTIADTQIMVLRCIGALVSFETMVVLASAALRLARYADAHGLTRARIFGFVFLIWMAISLVFFIARLLNKIGYKEFFISLAVTTIISLYAVSIWNIDRIIAVEFQPTVNEEIDYYYIAKLSPDAVDGWEEAISDAEATIVDLESTLILTADDNRKLFYVSDTLYMIKADVIYLGHDKKWQSINLSELRAYERIKKDPDFEKITDLQERVKVLQERISEEARQSTQLDRATEQPLSE